MHCLPADITGLSCKEGEVDNSVFDRYIVPLYKQASYKPYIIAAMIFMSQVKDPVKTLMELDAADNHRKLHNDLNHPIAGGLLNAPAIAIFFTIRGKGRIIMSKRIVIALGGNALGNTAAEQLALVTNTAKAIVDLIAEGNEGGHAHGNGPQVGMINLGLSTAAEAGAIKADMPFPECGAMSEGYIGYHLQQAIGNELASAA